MEAILVLATLARKWTMRHDPTHQVIPDGQVTLRPKYGMRMTLARRRQVKPKAARDDLPNCSVEGENSN